MTDLIFKAEQPILCDCGHTYKVSVIGLDENTKLSCPKCGNSYCLDRQSIEKIEEDFIEMVDDMFTMQNIDVPDYTIIKFMRMHNRTPDESEIAEMMKRGEFY